MQIEQIVAKILEPPVFFGMLGAIFIVSLLVIRSTASSGKELRREQKEETQRDKRRVAELEAMVVGREEEHKHNIAQLKEEAKSKQGGLEKRIVELEGQLKDAAQSKTNASKLEMQLREKEEALKKAISSSEELNKTIKKLQDESAKFKSELSLKTQMYDGLKGQYDELERDVTRLNRQLEEESKRQQGHLSQSYKEAPKPKEQLQPEAGLRLQPPTKPQERVKTELPEPKQQPANPEEKSKQPQIAPNSESGNSSSGP